MEFTGLSLLGAFCMLVYGLVQYLVLKRMLYGVLRDRYERAKLTMSQGLLEPGLFWAGFKLLNMVVLPVLGFVYGELVLRPYFT